MSAYFTSNTYYDWLIDRAYFLVPAQAYVANFLGTFQEFPPRQKAGSFNLDQVMQKPRFPVARGIDRPGRTRSERETE